MGITGRCEEVEVLFCHLPPTIHISFINIYSLEQYSLALLRDIDGERYLFPPVILLLFAHPSVSFFSETAG
jgi:hypothetical protein